MTATMHYFIILFSIILGIIATLAMGADNPEYIAAAQVDVIELNHVYTEQDGEHSLDQWIFWCWDWNHSEFRVVAWRMAKAGDRVGDRVVVFDGERMCIVRGESQQRRWLQRDAEVDDRKILAVTERRGLVGTPTKH